MVWEQGKGIINNLGALRTKAFEDWGFYNPATSEVYNWDGNLSPVVHQFDRDKHLVSVDNAFKIIGCGPLGLIVLSVFYSTTTLSEKSFNN